MSEKYDEYLKNHINAVNECYKLLTGKNVGDCYYMGDNPHDKSKYSPEEYDAYDEYFYPSDGSKVGEDPKRKEAFQYAWLHHQNNNPHHWQFWVDIDGKDDIKALKMPLDRIYEMVADWGAFAYLQKNGHHLKEWYEKNKDKMILHDETRSIVEALVTVLEAKIIDYFGEAEE